jgi:acetyltransferase-like isoleucine patch superfamily enzyme
MTRHRGPQNGNTRQSRIPPFASKAVRKLLNRTALSGLVTPGKGLRTGWGTTITSRHGLIIGDFASVGPRSTISVSGTIGHFFLAASSVLIVGKDDHSIAEVGVPVSVSTWIGDRQPTPRDRVTIGHDVWIGAGAVVVSGISIGDGAVIAAGSVVVSDVDSFTVVAGNPAKPVRRRFHDDDARHHHLQALLARIGPPSENR